jgi:iron complex outermembrane receptor protein
MLDNDGNYTVTKNFNSVSRFTIGSNLAYLHGHFDTFGTRNDLALGIDGFVNRRK